MCLKLLTRLRLHFVCNSAFTVQRGFDIHYVSAMVWLWLDSNDVCIKLKLYKAYNIKELNMMNDYRLKQREIRIMSSFARCSVKCLELSFSSFFVDLFVTAACCRWLCSNWFENWPRIVVGIIVSRLSHHVLDEMPTPLFFFPFSFLFYLCLTLLMALNIECFYCLFWIFEGGGDNGKELTEMFEDRWWKFEVWLWKKKMKIGELWLWRFVQGRR